MAWGLAWWSQSLLDGEPGRTQAMVLLIVAGLLAVIAWGGAAPRPGLVLGMAGRLIMLDWRRALRFAGIGGALALVWAADQAFLARPLEPFGQAGWLWLASMALLIISTVNWPQAKAERGTRSAELPARAALPTPNLQPPTPASWTRWEIAAFLGLVALAFALRLWDLQSLPYAVHGDEILTARVAKINFAFGNNHPIFGTVWDGIDLPALWFKGVAVALDWGGGTLAAVRAPAAIAGALMVIPFYGLVRAAWGRAAALAGTAMMAYSASQVHYSRVTINNIVTPLGWAVCFFFLLRGLRRGRPVDWVLAGIAAGLSEYSYYGTHLLPFILLAFGLYLLVVHWRQGWRYLGHMALLAVGYLAAFGPLLAYFMRFRPDIYFGRGAAGGVLTWNHIPRDLADLQLMWNTLWPLFAENLLGMSVHTSQDTVYWAPLLFTFEAALLVLGTALLIWQWRHPAAFLMLLSGLGTLFVGGTLVHGVPFIAHWTPAFPAFFAAIAAPIAAWAVAWPRLRPRLRRLGPVLLVAGLLVGAGVNIDFYFRVYYIERPEFEIRAAQNRWAAALGPNYQVWSAGPTWQPYDPESMALFVRGQTGGVLQDPNNSLPAAPAPGQGLAFIFFPDNEQYRPRIVTAFPGGKDGEVKSSNGTHLFYTYVLPPRQSKEP